MRTTRDKRAAAMLVPLEALAIGDETQAREKLDAQAIVDYAEAMAAGATFPSVVLFRDAAGRYWIGDGYHRIAAAHRIGREAIIAEVRRGDQRDARFYAAQANQTNGLRRTDADKRQAVRLLLEDEEWCQWSDRQIAAHCGVSPTFVGSVRASLSTVDSENSQRTYTTKHGTVATMDTTHIGRRGAAEEEPPSLDLPLDDARVTEVTPEPDEDLAEDAEWGEDLEADERTVRRRYRPIPPDPLSAEAQEQWRWDYLSIQLASAFLNFGRDGGIKPLLGIWTAEERARARAGLAKHREQIDRLDAEIAAVDRPAP